MARKGKFTRELLIVYDAHEVDPRSKEVREFEEKLKVRGLHYAIMPTVDRRGSPVIELWAREGKHDYSFWGPNDIDLYLSRFPVRTV